MSKYLIVEVPEEYEVTAAARKIGNIIYEGSNCFIMFGEGTQSRNIRPSGQLMIDEKKCFKQNYIETLDKIKNAYKNEAGHVVVGSILVEVDMHWELTEKTTLKSRRKIDIRRATGVEKVYTGAQYVLKCKQWWLERWSDAQLHAAFLSQLVRINEEDGSIIDFDEDISSHMITTFGAGYLNEHVSIPDIIEQKVEIKGFQRADKQVTIDDIGEESNVVPIKKVN